MKTIQTLKPLVLTTFLCMGPLGACAETNQKEEKATTQIAAKQTEANTEKILAEFFQPYATKKTLDLNDKDYADLLKTYVRPGPTGIHLFDYKGVSDADRQKLTRYLRYLQSIDPALLTQTQQFAFFANLYNAKTLDVILTAYPVKSIKEVEPQGGKKGIVGALTDDGPWKAKNMKLKGKMLSLDDVEHNILRKNMNDPRVHYAVNCASIGCPNLQTAPWKASTLDAALNEAARAYVNHPRGVQVKANGDVVASSIYKWFQEDFGKDDKDVLLHLQKYATGQTAEMLKDKLKIAEYDYDWGLNEINEKNLQRSYD